MKEKPCPFLKIGKPGQIPPILCTHTGFSLLKESGYFVRHEKCLFPDLTTQNCELLPGVGEVTKFDPVEPEPGEDFKMRQVLEKS